VALLLDRAEGLLAGGHRPHGWRRDHGLAVEFSNRSGWEEEE
jgi:hypothetical protein